MPIGDAIFHLSVTWLSRAAGRNAVAAAAYRAAERLENPADPRGYSDFRRKHNRTLHTKIYTPPGSPAWAKDRAELWQAAEAAERRTDARTAIEIEFAVPYHVPEAERLRLIDEMAALYVADGHVVDAALHTGEDGENPHVHLLLTTRAMTGKGLAKVKIKGYDQKRFVYSARERWEQVANIYLNKAGSALRVDRRSYAERGLAERPERHRGIDRLERAAKRASFTQPLEAHRMAQDNRTAPAQRILAQDDRSLFSELAKRGWPPAGPINKADLTPRERGELEGYRFAVRNPEADPKAVRLVMSMHERQAERASERNKPDERDRDEPTKQNRARETALDMAKRLLPKPERPLPPNPRAEQDYRRQQDYNRFLKRYFPEQYERERKREVLDMKRERRRQKPLERDQKAFDKLQRETAHRDTYGERKGVGESALDYAKALMAKPKPTQPAAPSENLEQRTERRLLAENERMLEERAAAYRNQYDDRDGREDDDRNKRTKR